MRRPITYGLVMVAVLLAGCGSANTRHLTAPVPKPTVPFVCVHKLPGQLGECVRQELEAQGINPAAPVLGAVLGSKTHEQCVDVSVFQGHPNWRLLRQVGVRCVIVQTSDYPVSNPIFDSQVRGAHEAGLAVGAYLFTEANSSETQAVFAGRIAARESSRLQLGIFIDTEVPGSYERACGIASVLRSRFHAKIVGDYGSIGVVPASLNHCGLLDWPAQWGGAPARPAAGFSFASMVLRQWCGTCTMPGVSGQIDRDEDLGLIALGKPKPKPKPETPKQERAKLAELRRLLGAYVPANEVEAPVRQFNPHGHNCQHPPFKHAYPSARFNGACEKWAQQVRSLKAKGVH